MSRVLSLLYRKGFSAYRRFTRRPYSWVDYAPDEQALSEMRRRAVEFSFTPVVSVIMPVYNSNLQYLKEAIESVLSQTYGNLELCVADDASTDESVRVVLKQYAAQDERIKLVFRKKNGHISKASNSALELASGEYVALLDHDDCLAPHALFKFVEALNEDREIEFVYSDEDKIDSRGFHSEPTFKPGWSPDYLTSFMYTGHLSIFKKSLIDFVGGFREGFEGSQDHDLTLRASEVAKKIKHIPEILYHWRKHPGSVAQNIDVKSYAFKNATQAVKDALVHRTGFDWEVAGTQFSGVYRPILRQKMSAKVGVLVRVPEDMDSVQVLSQIRESVNYADADFYIWQKAKGAPVTERVDESGMILRGSFASGVVDFWREACRLGDSEHVLLLDGRLQPKDKDWFYEMLTWLTGAGAAVVGGRIQSSSGLNLHSGYVVTGGRTVNTFFKWPVSHPGYAARLAAVTNVSAVSSRCLMLNKERLTRILNSEDYKSGASLALDVCLSALRAGRRVVSTPHASFVYRGKSFDREYDSATYFSDLKGLEKKHEITAFVDPYYPAGLETRNFSYRLMER